MSAQVRAGNVEAVQEETVYYDADCGICRTFVRFVVRHDHQARLRLLPLEGASLPPGLPDSVVVQRQGGVFLTRSDAVIAVLRSLGWRRAAVLLNVIPRGVRDFFYNLVAKTRKRTCLRQ